MSEADWILKVYESGNMEYGNADDIESILVHNGADPDGETIISGMSHEELVSAKKDIVAYYKEKYFPSYNEFVSAEIFLVLYTLLKDELFPEVRVAEKELTDFLTQRGWARCNSTSTNSYEKDGVVVTISNKLFIERVEHCFN